MWPDAPTARGASTLPDEAVVPFDPGHSSTAALTMAEKLDIMAVGETTRGDVRAIEAPKESVSLDLGSILEGAQVVHDTQLEREKGMPPIAEGPEGEVIDA